MQEVHDGEAKHAALQASQCERFESAYGSLLNLAAGMQEVHDGEAKHAALQAEIAQLDQQLQQEQQVRSPSGYDISKLARVDVLDIECRQRLPACCEHHRRHERLDHAIGMYVTRT